MTYEIVIVMAILVFVVIAFATDFVRSDLVGLIAMALLMATGVLSPEEAILGFSSPATITVACMFIISAALVRAGVVHLASMGLLRWKSLTPFWATALIMGTAGPISAFINNTAAVAVFLPIVNKIAQMVRVSRKQLLMPLSFAAIFGGSCTLIGTSTNILVDSIYIDHGHEGFGLFEITGIGYTLAIIGSLYMLTIGRYLLRSPPSELPTTDAKRYVTEVVMERSSPSVGLRLRESPFYRDFRDNIFALNRGDTRIPPDANPELMAGDQFTLLCGIDKINALKSRTGFSILETQSGGEAFPQGFELYEVIVPINSVLVGRELYRTGLGQSQGIVPLAIRHQQRTFFSNLRRKLIRPGDVLIIAGRPQAVEELEKREGLVLMSAELGVSVNWRLLVFALVIISSMLAVVSLGVMNILGAAILAALGFLVTRSLSLRRAYKALDGGVLVLLASILSLGLALEKSGAASLIADFLVQVSGALGPVFVVSILYLTTSLLTEVMSNNATAALLTPVALHVASVMGLSEKPFLVAVMLAGSASFMTPVGYQTNTLIFAPGGYKFGDFLKIGTPLNILFWLCATFLIPKFFPF